MTALTKTVYSQDVIFILLVLSFLLIALLKGLYWKHARLFFKGVLAQRFANQYLREDNAFTERVGLLTFLLMIINITLIISKFKQLFDLHEIALVLSLVFLFFFLKMLVIKILGSLFKVKDLAKLAVFFSFLFDKTFGFVLFPLVVVLWFFILDMSFFVLFISFVLFCLFLCLKVFWLWKIGTNSFGLSRPYIFLYLCIIEIFPLLLLGKGVFY